MAITARRRRLTDLAVPADVVERVPRAEVDIALVLAVDSSGSISEQRLSMQIQGYLDAIRHPSFIEAVHGGRRGRIGLTFVTWTDARRQDQTVPWQVIEDEAGAERFCQGVQNALRPVPGWTSISGAIDFCANLLLTSGYIATRQVIDVSGDGANNDGRPVTEARDAAVSAGIIINGLPIMNDRPNPFGFPNETDLDKYYLACVTGGPHSFVEVARNFDDFPRAIRKKLLQEVADSGPRPEVDVAEGPALRNGLQLAQAGRPYRRRGDDDYTKFVRPEYALGCDIGERRSREFWQRRFGTSPD